MSGDIILIVDDEDLVRWTLTRWLQKAGYQTLEASNIRDAYDIIRRQSVDLVLLDQMLPDGNGIALLEELRRNGLRLPVICTPPPTSS